MTLTPQQRLAEIIGRLKVIYHELDALQAECMWTDGPTVALDSLADTTATLESCISCDFEPEGN